MRIITGTARGTRLDTLEGDNTRPTTDRVKEGLFSSIQFQIAGRRVLDLFCGSGQLSLEALSRGAEFAVLVDAERKATEIAKQNALRTKLMKQTRIVTSDYKDFLKNSKEQFNLIFLDPPYSPKILDEVLTKLHENDIIGEEAIIVCESAEDGIPKNENFEIIKTYKYGKVFVSLLKKI